MREQRRPTGVRARHSRKCATRDARRCNCTPTYEAWTYDAREGKKVRKSFPTQAAAKTWRHDAASAVPRGTLNAGTTRTVRQAADEWLEQAKDGRALTRSGARYKPGTLRTHEHDLNTYVLDDLGAVRLANLRRRDVQALVDRLVADGLSGSTVRNAIMPLRVICRHALERDEIAVNPTVNLRLPEAARRRERVATPDEAARLIAALPAGDQAVWATAMYAGLRRGELRALRWSDLDVELRVIHVTRSWDPEVGVVDPKSKKGVRTVPVAAALRLHLLEHKARTGRRGDELVFGRTPTEPFTPTNLRARAVKAWKKAKLAPITLHECRHTFVTMMFEAGVSLERVGDYAGHGSTYMTDRYRHLLDGHEQQAAEALDAFLSVRLAHRLARNG